MPRSLKLFSLMLSVSTLLAFVLPFPTLAAVGQLDQANEVETTDGGLTIRSHQEICQTFIPALNRLNQVGFFVENASIGDTVTVTVKDLSANQTIVTTTATIDTADGWNVAPFDAVKVYSDHLYALCLNTTSTTMTWTYKNTDTYPKGYAIWDSKDDYTKDFGFLTFGLNVTEETSDETNSSQDTSSSSDAATEQQNSNLAPPTNLKAQDVPNDQGKAIKLSWQASASDVEGYNIYRRQKQDEEFGKIASVQSNVLVYIDETVQPNQEYEYRLTAYANNEESSPSETVKAKAIDNIPPAKPQSLEVKVDKEQNLLEISWEANNDEDLAAYILTVQDEKGKIVLLKEISKEQTKFTTQKLDLSKSYTLKVQAKDSSGNVSGASEFKYQPELKLAEPVVAKEQTKNRLKLYLSIIFAAIALVGSIGIVLWNRYKKTKAKVDKTAE